MSDHDKIRLEKGKLALVQLHEHEIKGLTDFTLADEERKVAEAITGIQSTDDPSPEYGKTESALIKRLRMLSDEVERRARSSRNRIVPQGRFEFGTSADKNPPQPSKEASMWEMLSKLAGDPDYAVCVMAWPWPDGGWMAGIALHDHGWAERQKMSPAVLNLNEEVRSPTWNVYDGFANGINVHSTDGPGAVRELVREIEVREKVLDRDEDE